MLMSRRGLLKTPTRRREDEPTFDFFSCLGSDGFEGRRTLMSSSPASGLMTFGTSKFLYNRKYNESPLVATRPAYFCAERDRYGMAV
jgi:hypothetical protein